MLSVGIGKRLREAREKAGITQEELGKRIGVTGSAITNYEKETSHPKEPVMYALMDALGIEPNFLFQDCVSSLKSKDSSQNFSLDELSYIKKYRTLDGYGKEAVNGILDIEFKRCSAMHSKLQEVSLLEFPAKTLPFRYSMQSASAGTGTYLGPEAFETMLVKETPLTRRVSFGIPVNGDSMEPQFHNGDMLLIERTKEIRIGEIGVFTLNGEGYVKELGDKELLSLNPEYQPIKITGDISCNGRVIGVLDPTLIISQ